jgi:hypothetical protein
MELQTISDRAEISDLLGLYCRGVDRVDEATLRSIYHDDAIEDRGEGLFIGLAQEWVGWTLGLLPAFSLSQHCIFNILIDVDGDTAYSETYFNAYHRFADGIDDSSRDNALAGVAVTTDDVAWPTGGTELLLAGRYLDRFERRDGVWKIAYRKMICDWCRVRPVADGWFEENPTAYRASRTIADSHLESSRAG